MRYLLMSGSPIPKSAKGSGHSFLIDGTILSQKGYLTRLGNYAAAHRLLHPPVSR